MIKEICQWFNPDVNFCHYTGTTVDCMGYIPCDTPVDEGVVVNKDNSTGRWCERCQLWTYSNAYQRCNYCSQCGKNLHRK